MKIFRFNLIAIFLLFLTQVLAEERVQGRRSLVLENEKVRLVIDIAGGSIPEFRFIDSNLNQLNWGRRNPVTSQVQWGTSFVVTDGGLHQMLKVKMVCLTMVNPQKLFGRC